MGVNRASRAAPLDCCPYRYTGQVFRCNDGWVIDS